MHWTALFISIYLSWHLYLVFPLSLSPSPDMTLLILCQMYRTHTFSRVGPPKNVLRMYRVCVLSTFASPELHIDAFTVFSRGLGQHPIVAFRPGERIGALGRPTSSWPYQKILVSHSGVRWNVYYNGCGTLSDTIVTLPHAGVDYPDVDPLVDDGIFLFPTAFMMRC